MPLLLNENKNRGAWRTSSTTECDCLSFSFSGPILCLLFLPFNRTLIYRKSLGNFILNNIYGYFCLIRAPYSIRIWEIFAKSKSHPFFTVLPRTNSNDFIKFMTVRELHFNINNNEVTIFYLLMYYTHISHLYLKIFLHTAIHLEYENE